jgi:hypothetical protein
MSVDFFGLHIIYTPITYWNNFFCKLSCHFFNQQSNTTDLMENKYIAVSTTKQLFPVLVTLRVLKYWKSN